MPPPADHPDDDRSFHDRLTRNFAEAAGLTGPARADFLAELRATAPDVAIEVEALLAIDESDQDDGGDWIAGAVRPLAEQLSSPPLTAGERIGEYEVERLLGAGGGGDVYLARQRRPERRVAVKVMRHGLVDPARQRRFEFEAQLLARLQHPGIAQVFAFDVFEDRGQHRPFFVMEYVEGAATLTVHAERIGLGVRQRIELLTQVCEAVGYGHHHGVVHCDLKPDNLLVGPLGTAKVIDFGIARAAEGEPHRTTVGTGTYSLAGTLPYMSPEQASGAPDGLDARADVYGLGVICFELLAGQLPIDVAGTALPVAAQRIATADPQRLGSVAPHCRGDLEIIAAKCLEKDRDRRYEDALELARDLRRFLDHEPIVARPPTATYQLRKFARRHSGLVAGAAVALMALVVGSAVAVQQAWIATRGEIVSRWQTYRASIAAASAALANHDVALARESLESAPPEHHNWEWHHLTARLEGSFAVLRPPGQAPLDRPAFVTHDERRCVAVFRLGTVHFFDLETHELVGNEPATAFASDGPSATVARVDGQALWISRRGGRPVRWNLTEVGIAWSSIDGLAIAHGGRWLLVSNADRAIRIDLETGEQATVAIDRGGTGVTATAISQHGVAILAAGRNGRPGIWPRDGDELLPLSRVGSYGRSVAFDATGETFAMGLQDTTIGLWDVASRNRIMRGDGHRHAVTGVTFTTDGETLCSVSLDRTLRLWHAGGLAPRAILQGHERGIRHVTSDHATGTLATSSEDGTVRLWDGKRTSDAGVLAGHEDLVFPTRFSHDGSLIASAGSDRTVRLWATATERCVAVIPTELRTVVDLAFAADDSRLVIASRDRLLALDLDTGTRLAMTPPLVDLQGSLRGLTFAPDGRRVLIPQALPNHEIATFDSETGTIATARVNELRRSGSRSVSADGRFVVLGERRSAGGSAHSADSDSGAGLVVHDLQTDRVVDLPRLTGAFAWLPRGHQLAARPAADPTTIAIYDLARGERVATLSGHRDRIYAVAASPDGSRLATCARDGLRLWAVGRDAATAGELGDRIVALDGHTSFVWSVSWSADGAMLASGSGDRSVRLWNSRSAAELAATRRTHGSYREADLAELRARFPTPRELAVWLRSGPAATASSRSYLRLCLLASRKWH
ncbi:MAG: protein kinase [bacterium]|nr:protein kinase [bacterium]